MRQVLFRVKNYIGYVREIHWPFFCQSHNEHACLLTMLKTLFWQQKIQKGSFLQTNGTNYFDKVCVKNRSYGSYTDQTLLKYQNRVYNKVRRSWVRTLWNKSQDHLLFFRLLWNWWLKDILQPGTRILNFTLKSSFSSS